MQEGVQVTQQDSDVIGDTTGLLLTASAVVLTAGVWGVGGVQYVNERLCASLGLGLRVEVQDFGEILTFSDGTHDDVGLVVCLLASSASELEVCGVVAAICKEGGGLRVARPCAGVATDKRSEQRGSCGGVVLEELLGLCFDPIEGA